MQNEQQAKTVFSAVQAGGRLGQATGRTGRRDSGYRHVGVHVRYRARTERVGVWWAAQRLSGGPITAGGDTTLHTTQT
jgi:hypothetical protein